jgi:hypothetical protein
VQLNAGPGGSAGADVVGAAVRVLVALGLGAAVVGVGVVGALRAVVVACGAAVLGVVGLVSVAVDCAATRVGAAAGNVAATDRVLIAKPAKSVIQTRNILALRPSLSRRRW